MEATKRYQGTVQEFKTQRGFGYLKLKVEDKNDKEKNKVFVHWKQIHTDDRWPALEAGMEVEYGIEKGQRDRYQAKHVTLPGGGKIKKEDKNVENVFGKYTGTVTFFNYRTGTGFIEVDKPIPGVDLGPKNSLNVARNEIITDDETPTLRTGQKVSFGVFKSERAYGARNVTGPGGKKIHNPKPTTPNKPRNAGPNRNNNRAPMRDKNVFQGNQFNWRNGPAKRQRDVPGSWGGGRDPSFQKRPRRQMRPMRPMLGGKEGESEDQQVEVGLCVKTHHVGGLIGKKGVTIKQMRKDSGAVLQLGDDDIFWDGEPHRVMALSGLKEEVAKACKLVAKRIGDAAQSIDHKIIYLVPEETMGMLIGKKGSNINKIKGEKPSERVRITISQEAVQLPGANRVNMCALFGGQQNVARAIDAIVDTLGWISQKIQADQAMMEAEQAMQQRQNYGPPMDHFQGGAVPLLSRMQMNRGPPPVWGPPPRTPRGYNPRAW